MDPAELERRVDRELRRLPGPVAPGTLFPRVMSVARQLAARPWYTRAWMTWPGGWQAASAAAVVALVVAIGMVLPIVQAEVFGPVTRVLDDAIASVGESTATIRAGREVIEVLWRLLIEPVAGYLLILLVVMWAACAAFSVALTRVAFGEAIQP